LLECLENLRFSIHLYFFIKKLKGLIIHKIYKLACKRAPLPRNRRFPRAVPVHRSGIAESHARESSTAQELCIPTRGSAPPPRNRRTLRAGVVHRSGIAESHARESSTAQKSQNLTRGNRPPLRNSGISRAGTLYDNLSSLSSSIFKNNKDPFQIVYFHHEI